MQLDVKCNEPRLVDVSTLKPHPKNNNKHSPEQIERLSQIIEYNGFRNPIVVSKASGFITKGHARLEAAKKLGWAQVPVDFQEYKSEEAEYADITADNAIASWAQLDLSMVNLELENLGPDFDLDLLGIPNFTLEPSIKNTGTELNLNSFDNFEHQCPKCGFEWNANGSDNS